MKPQGHLALAEGVGLAFSETELTFGDRLVATAAFGAAGGGGFDEVRH
jgi:hypothetical protein